MFDISKKLSDSLFQWLASRRYGSPIDEHTLISRDIVEIFTWDKGVLNDPNDLSELEARKYELKNTDRKTTDIPNDLQVVVNMMVDGGLNAYGKNRTGESIKTNVNALFGTGTTGELATNTQIETQVLAKSFTTDGSRQNIDASFQEKYLMPVLDTDYTGSLTEAGLADGPAPPTDTLITRYTFTAVTISAVQLAQFLTTVTKQRGIVA